MGLGTPYLSPQILQQLDAFKAVPDFNNYLAYIFAKGEQLSVEVRPHCADPAKQPPCSSLA